MAAEPLRLNLLSFLLCLLLLSPALAQTVHVRAEAGARELKAAEDLAHYLGLMLEREVALVSAAPRQDETLRFVVGEMALELSDELRRQLAEATPSEWLLRDDAVAMASDRNLILLAGSNDDSHYYAVARFLHQQGCRWYLPGSWGEHVPRREELDLTVLPAYAPPFQSRNYWVAWNGDRTGYEEFAYRNFLHTDRPLVGSHALGNALKGSKLVLHDPATVAAVADLLEPKYARGENLSLGISDAIQKLDDPEDLRRAGGFDDKFFHNRSVTDAYLPFYNKVIEELVRRRPESSSLFSFLAYTNMTLPPQRAVTGHDRLVAFLAPIDIDPNHPFSNPSPGKADLLGALRRWTEVMEGRVVIYDYDQSMLVWRDLPNPSHQVVAEDVRVYRDLGILGLSTETRHAHATTFTNLFFRGQLYWNPDLDVDAELELFYQNFYGPLSAPMKEYWSAIFAAWHETEVVDHEFFVAPKIYTPGLVKRLEQALSRVEEIPLPGEILRRRRDFTLASFRLIQAYSKMNETAAVEADYEEAASRGREALKLREALAGTAPGAINSLGERGAAWWPGEVAYYESLAGLEKVAATPLRWNFKSDPSDHGLWRNWGATDDFREWRTVRVDAMPRHQGVDPSGRGYAWYACRLEVDEPNGSYKLVFPGLFNNAWLYLNGDLVDWREQKELWWSNDYRFLWIADLGDSLTDGRNTVILRTELKEHPSGMFRRPFLIRSDE